MAPIKIFIDSASRVDGSFSNFSFQLPRPVDVGKQYRAMVDQIHIPHVFATITANNRALYFEEDDNAIPEVRQRKVLLAEGQYSGDQLAAEVQSKMQTTTQLWHADATYEVAFDADQGKLSFRITGGSPWCACCRWNICSPTLPISLAISAKVSSITTTAARS